MTSVSVATAKIIWYSALPIEKYIKMNFIEKKIYIYVGEYVCVLPSKFVEIMSLFSW